MDDRDGKRPSRADLSTQVGRTDDAVQKTRSWTGLLVVALGDTAIAVTAIFGILKSAGNANAQLVAILSSAFTAIGTMTTAYFGIRAISNTAQKAVEAVPGPPGAVPAPPGDRDVPPEAPRTS